MAQTDINYYACRIDNANNKFLYEELKKGRLRQGWGYNDGQNLKNMTFDKGARRNRPMLKVKKDDIILVPHIKGYNILTFVKATEDWDKGYSFNRNTPSGDYGHIFPAEIVMSINKWDANVPSSIHKTLKSKSRFWSLNPYAESIKKILSLSPQETAQFNPRKNMHTFTEDIFEQLFDHKAFKDKIYKHCCDNYQSTNWEFLLTEALKVLYPQYIVEHTAGKTEKEHGADITITIPGLFGSSYIIAIQVKDYEGKVWNKQDVIDQINKAENYFNKGSSKVIEKIVFVIRVPKELNDFPDEESGVKFFFAEDIQELLSQAAHNIIGIA